jgi:hypothetical protein
MSVTEMSAVQTSIRRGHDLRHSNRLSGLRQDIADEPAKIASIVLSHGAVMDLCETVRHLRPKMAKITLNEGIMK